MIDLDLRVVLIDFGSASFLLGKDRTFTDTVGSHSYFSPESLNGLPYSGKLADSWALGVTFYQVVFQGVMPFKGKTRQELYRNIVSYEVDLDSIFTLKMFKGQPLGELEKIHKIIGGFLQKNPCQRLSIEGALSILEK